MSWVVGKEMGLGLGVGARFNVRRKSEIGSKGPIRNRHKGIKDQYDSKRKGLVLPRSYCISNPRSSNAEDRLGSRGTPDIIRQCQSQSICVSDSGGVRDHARYDTARQSTTRRDADTSSRELRHGTARHDTTRQESTHTT